MVFTDIFETRLSNLVTKRDLAHILPNEHPFLSVERKKK